MWNSNQNRFHNRFRNRNQLSNPSLPHLSLPNNGSQDLSNNLSKNELDTQKWFRSVALIRQIKRGENQWLARATKSRPNLLNFVSAPRLGRESFHETIRREVAWELRIDQDCDFLISRIAQLDLSFVHCSPADASQGGVAVMFFLIEIFGDDAKATIRHDRSNRWLTSQDVCKGESANGERLDSRLIFLLDRARLIQ